MVMLLWTCIAGYAAGSVGSLISNPADNIVSAIYNRKADSFMLAIEKIGFANLFTRSLPIRLLLVGPSITLQWFFYDTIKVLGGLEPSLPKTDCFEVYALVPGLLREEIEVMAQDAMASGVVSSIAALNLRLDTLSAELPVEFSIPNYRLKNSVGNFVGNTETELATKTMSQGIESIPWNLKLLIWLRISFELTRRKGESIL
ncbi:hypothetical protein PIB30_073545 [Stylosanthes scabra]|uniref:Uncharacterized protein n=1 Tax=Stylosanthes scabra TaxID=79078 RepID=A0ABU6XMU4_9FABA|nr:hypothetical protein [Stylosanthes scabra]